MERLDDWMSGYPDLAARRFLHSAPVALWRLGLGPVAGRWWMLLTTRGRATGLPRRTPLTPHPMGGHLYAWDPYGERSHWYRNLTADPIVTVQTSKGAWTARAVRPDDDAEVAQLYELLRRFDARMLRRYLESLAIGDSVADVVANKDRLHVVRLDPTSLPGPPSLGADRAWAWALLALAAFVPRIAGLRPGGRRGK